MRRMRALEHPRVLPVTGSVRAVATVTARARAGRGIDRSKLLTGSTTGNTVVSTG